MTSSACGRVLETVRNGVRPHESKITSIDYKLTYLDPKIMSDITMDLSICRHFQHLEIRHEFLQVV